MTQTKPSTPFVKISEILLIIIFYFLMAQLGFLFSIPPGNVTLIWLPSGLSIASILLFGRRALIGIWLGSFIANLWQTGGGSLNFSTSLLLISACIATGSSLQTFVANILIRTFSPIKDSIEISLNNILKFFGLTATACLVAATMGVGTLFIAGQVAPGSFMVTWLTWWMGDLLGIIVGAPLFLGLGRSMMKRSLQNIDPTIMISIGISISVLLFILSWTNDVKSFDLKFEADSKEIQNSIKTTFEYAVHDLEAAQNLFSVDREITRDNFKTFTQQHLYGEHATPGLQGLSWNPYITLDNRPAFEEAVRKEGFPDFQITERNADGKLLPAATRPDYVVVDFIEPLDSNKPALGFDVSSNPVRLAALTNARDTGKITITAPITLVQDTGNHPGFLVFAPVYKQGSSTETIEDRQTNLRGFVVSVIRVDRLVNSSIDFLTEKDKEIYIFDLDMPEGKQFIYFYSPKNQDGTTVTPPDPSLVPDTLQKDYYYSGTITVADRHWMVVIKPEPEAIAKGRTSLPWFVLSTSLFITALSTLYLINSQKSSTAIRRQLDSEKVVAEISQQFMKIDLESKDQIIQSALASIGRQVGVDRCYLFIYDEPNEEFHFAYEWRAEGVSSSVNFGRSFKIADYPQSFNAILQGDVVNISRMSDFPDNSLEAKILKSENIQSMLNIPVFGENGMLGFIGFDSTHVAPIWREAEINLLQIVGRIIASGLEHIQREQEILRLNQSLEQRVQERTEALRESQESLQKFLDSASDLIQSVDEKGNYLYVNAAWCETLGYTQEEAQQISMFQIVDPPYHEHCVQLMKELITSNSARTIEVVFRTKDGTPVTVEGSISTHPENNGRLVTQGFFRDITQRKADEVALRESYDRLNITKIALEQAMSVRDEFLASMSHELRTPLAGILGLSEALQLGVYDTLNQKQEKTIRNIQESSKHLLDLINDILDLSSIEAGKLELKFSPCSLDDICQSSLQLTKGMAHKKRQYVNYVPPSEPVMLNVDERRVKQIIVNMLSNAIKFTHENGEVGLSVELDKPNQQVRLIVWDKGIGIKPEHISKLFQPFTQIDSSLGREYSGTGLGLSLVKQLVTLHNGNVEVSSVFGEGSRFTVTLPWTDQTQSSTSPELGQSTQDQNATVPDVQSLSSLVLIADDNPLLLNMMSDFLEALHYRTAKAQTGTEVLDVISKLRPDLILMDIQMPGLDGLETIHRIRKHTDPEVARTQIIAITALAMEGDRERCLSAGANDYISKPVRLQELKDLINHLLEGNEQKVSS